MSSGHIRIKPHKIREVKPENKRFRKVDAPKSNRKTRKRKKVLNKEMISSILGIVSIFTPKPIRIMLTWLKERLTEPSTYQGITTLAAAVGYTVNPEAWEAIATLALGIIGFIQMMKKEPKLLEKK